MRCRLPGPQLPAQTASPPRDMGVGAGGEGADLLVADMQPFDAAGAAQRVGEAVEAVADDAVDALDAGGGENLDHLVGDGAGQTRHPRVRRCGSRDDRRNRPARNRARRDR